MSNKGLYTSGSTSYKVQGSVDSIPLRDTDATQPETDSLGTLVSNATEQVSTLVRSEIELAKTEVIGEVKKGVMGGALLAVAGVIGLYSSFFFFFFLAELLSKWMDRPWAFLIVFLLMLVTAAVLALVGVKRFKAINKPEKTIDSVNELKNLVPGSAQKNLAKDSTVLYTSTGTGSTVPGNRTGSTKVK
ncbi:phage holin family protein [Corynebacterium aquatimens]|uniref:Holin-X, holin superfamily III n=1 Tax=Corynebacterium aquatimens TaxID=1190508 RepID=A0A931GS04_9CORY|nr:phage holin family protein [Corynebacterium aquatimens]MBG6122533.1 hypothetical protein [Corynebacterium aquatimens]WJY64927.1 hypothetical protein CAQUA_00935 [Corynebacterium aquatimens]